MQSISGQSSRAYSFCGVWGSGGEMQSISGQSSRAYSFRGVWGSGGEMQSIFGAVLLCQSDPWCRPRCASCEAEVISWQDCCSDITRQLTLLGSPSRAVDRVPTLTRSCAKLKPKDCKYRCSCHLRSKPGLRKPVRKPESCAKLNSYRGLSAAWERFRAGHNFPSTKYFAQAAAPINPASLPSCA
jgi:hypothetical protein